MYAIYATVLAKLKKKKIFLWLLAIFFHYKIYTYCKNAVSMYE